MSRVQFESSQSPADFLPRFSEERWEKRSGAVQRSQDPHTRASNQQDTLKNDSAFFFVTKTPISLC